jgi:hypothetical protein
LILFERIFLIGAEVATADVFGWQIFGAPDTP